jgi:hypothetical protein
MSQSHSARLQWYLARGCRADFFPQASVHGAASSVHRSEASFRAAEVSRGGQRSSFSSQSSLRTRQSTGTRRRGISSRGRRVHRERRGAQTSAIASCRAIWHLVRLQSRLVQQRESSSAPQWRPISCTGTTHSRSSISDAALAAFPPADAFVHTAGPSSMTAGTQATRAAASCTPTASVPSRVDEWRRYRQVVDWAASSEKGSRSSPYPVAVARE